MLLSALVALVAFGVILEILLNFGKDYLLNTRGQAKLDASIQEAQADLRTSKQRIEERRAALRAAIEEADNKRGEIQAADKAFAESQKILPVLVHVVGLPNSGMRFRALVSKDLPATPDKSQKMIWACKNFVEVWAEDIQAAKTMISKQFQEVQGYKVGDLAPVEVSPSPSPGPSQEAAA